MSPLHDQLERVGQSLNRWQAEIRVLAWAAVVMTCLFAFGLSDFIFRYDFTGRMVLCAVVMALAVAGAAHIFMAMSRRHTEQAVAATVEKAFPVLDNHLINYVQFCATGGKDPLKAAYVARGVPQWSRIDLKAMKDRQKQRRSVMVFSMCTLLIATPWFWTGPAWANSLLRILNPFSKRAPSTLATIKGVLPGNRTILQGTPVLLTCSAEGKKGQPVWLDLLPADNKKSAVRVGDLSGAGDEDFSYRIPQLATDAKYRFRAGDAVSPLYQLRVRQPLAFTEIALSVKPPAYTGLKPQKFDGLSGKPLIPQGSEVSVLASCNYPLASGGCGVGEGVAPMKPANSGKSAAGSVTVAGPKDIHVDVTDTDGFKAEADLKFQLVPDQPPAIQVLSPKGKASLSAGASPRIQWQVSDDYGLAKVVLQRVTVDADGDVHGAPVQEWDASKGREFSTLWIGGPENAAGQTSVLFRVVATDNLPGKEPHRSMSPLIAFEVVTQEKAVEGERKAESDTAATLDKLIRLQTENLDETRKLDQTVDTAGADQWKGTLGRQMEIRKLAMRLMVDPRQLLGPLMQNVQRLYHGDMVEAIDVLRQVQTAQSAAKPGLSGRAVAVEARILAALSRVSAGAVRVKRDKEVTGLLALLDALVSGQDQTLGTTRSVVKGTAKIDDRLVKKQDSLSSDTTDFEQVCRKEAKNLESGDADFAKRIVQVADMCQSKAVAADMTRAAEKLEGGGAGEAVPFQEQALTALKACQALMNEWRTEEATEKLAKIREAAAEAQNKIQKLTQIQAKVVETIRAVDQQKDMSKKEYDEIQQELSELKENVEDGALEIAKDLHIFPELPVGNDLVEDVYQVFEEAQQTPGSAKTKASELGLQKEDMILDLLEKAQGRIDDMEMWLTDKPDAKKRNTENFDQAELPKIPALPMPSEMEDIIGDLLDQEEKEKDKADDSATNQGSADMAAGWDIAEGEFVNYSAKGKSGNERPEHKDQDGRSGVGRQGMSDGETTAGSGKINEGDKNIEKRRTQDSAQSGQVQEEGNAEAKATGGGKMGGTAKEAGMPGAGPRRDSSAPGSAEGMQAMLRRNAEALYAKASLMHIRTGSLDEAISNMRHAEEAMASGRIQQVREFQQRAVMALKKTQGQLGSGVMEQSVELETDKAQVPEQVTGVADEAPTNYRDLVAEYFKSLSQGK